MGGTECVDGKCRCQEHLAEELHGTYCRDGKYTTKLIMMMMMMMVMIMMMTTTMIMIMMMMTILILMVLAIIFIL